MANAIMFGQGVSSASLKAPNFSNSVHDYLSYTKKMQLRLAEINNNVSSVIQESCTGIDNICNRVRLCLNEMDQREVKVAPEEEAMEEEAMDKLKDPEEEDISLDIGEDTAGTLGDMADTLGDNGETLADASIIDSIDTGQTCDSSLSISKCFTMVEKEDLMATDNEELSNQNQVLKETTSLEKKEESILALGEDGESVGEVHFTNFKNTINTLCDNFEMMNELVESINKEITEFSETALPPEVINKSIKKSKVIKNKQKSTKPGNKNKQDSKNMQGDCSSEHDLDMLELVRDNSATLLFPDVYRKRAFTNLYQRLRKQVEASDSLMFFKTLMQRQKKRNINISISQCKLNIPILNYSIHDRLVTHTISKTLLQQTKKPDQRTTKVNLQEKYAGSLWFSPKHLLREKSTRLCSKKKNKKRSKHKKGTSGTKVTKNSSVQNKNLTSVDSSKTIEEAKITPAKFKSVEEIPKKVCSLECACKAGHKETGTSQGSNKCHLQWLKTRTHTGPRRRLKFIDMLDDLTTKDLLPLQSEYPRRDNEQARELEYKNIKETYLYKLMYGAQNSKNAWQHLLEPPAVKYSRNNKPRAYKTVRNIKEDKSFMERFCKQNSSKTDVLKKLSPYIYDPEKTHENYGKTVIVMPVQVFYEQIKMNEPPTKLRNTNKVTFSGLAKGPVSPSREIKPFKKPNGPGKTARHVKVVFDGLQNKLELPTISETGKQLPLISSARFCVEKGPLKKVTSKSLSPKSFAPYCHDDKYLKKDYLDVKYEQNVAIYNKIQADIETIKNEIYGKKFNKVDRKLWAHKYGKGVGQQLISFVQGQKPEPLTPIPKYALPQNRTNQPTNDARPIMESNFQKELTKCDLPKAKTEVIQTNIKKAIDVIEARMVDILSNNTNSVDAFNIMEKEITNILDLMKCKGQTNEAMGSQNKGKRDELEENYQIISDNLFERLERILSTGSSSTNTIAKAVIEEQDKEKEEAKLQTEKEEAKLKKEKEESKPKKEKDEGKPKKEKEEGKKKQKVLSSRRSKLDNPSPSTSTSMDEEVIKKRSPRSSKRVSKGDLKRRQKILAKNKEVVEPIPEENVAVNESRPETARSKPGHSKTSGSEQSKVNAEDVTVSNTLADSMDLSTTLTTDNIISDDKVEKLEERSDVSDAVFSSVECIGPKTRIEEFISGKLNKIMDSITVFDKEIRQIDQPKAVCKTKKNKKGSIKNKLNKIGDSLSAEEKDVEKPRIQSDTFHVEGEMGGFNNDETDPIKAVDKEKQMSQKEPSHQIKDVIGNVIDEMTKCEEEIANSRQGCEEQKDSTLKNNETTNNDNRQKTRDDYSQEMHKIIKRVEDIYYQLDDIQDTDSVMKIPVFKESNISVVQSEDFLTPFMHIVKESRDSSSSKTYESISLEKSPSYYNVMSFLDALSNIQQEVATEMHTVRMCHYPLICSEAKVYNLSETWHEANYSSSSNMKTSCLKKSTEDTRQCKIKRVSFLDIMRDQSSQVTLCPFHKMKVLRISSQQFPPVENSGDAFNRGLYTTPNRGEHIPNMIMEGTEVNMNKLSLKPKDGTKEELNESTEKKPEGINNEDVESKCDINKNIEDVKNISTSKCLQTFYGPQNWGAFKGDCSTDEERSPTIEDLSQQTCEGSEKIPLQEKGNNPIRTSQSEGGCEKTKTKELSVVDDKSTQVFCQMQNQQNSTDFGSLEEDAPLIPDEQPPEEPKCEEESLEDSKSSENFDDSLMDPFYDYKNDSITQKGVIQKIEEIYEEDNVKHKCSGQIQPKIVVFREVIDERKTSPLKGDLNSIEVLRRLEKRKGSRQAKKEGNEVARNQEDRDNVVLLKSFYAIVYILMFTALSLDYRCL